MAEGVRTETELFAIAWAVTRDAESAAGAVRSVMHDAATTDGPALVAAVVSAAIDRAPATAVLPLSLIEAALGDEPVDLVSLAAQASGLLDPRDRAVLEVAMHQGLGGVELARALECRPGTLAADVDAARVRAEHLVGSVLFAGVARTGCSELDEALAALPVDPAAADVAARVTAHVDGCAACADRRRALAPVANLLASADPPQPPVLAAPASGGQPRPRRLRLPAGRLARRAFLVALGTAVTVGVATAVVVLGGRTVVRSTAQRAGAGPSSPEVTPDFIDFGTADVQTRVTVHNPGAAGVVYRVRTRAPWIGAPARVRVPAGATRSIVVTLDRAATPEGLATTAIRIASAFGDVAIPVRAVVERPPALGAITVTPSALGAAACTGNTAAVAVPVVDESGLGPVVLRWRNADGNGGVVLTPDGTVERGALGPFRTPGPVTWWIVATDARGNRVTTPPQTVGVTAC